MPAAGSASPATRPRTDPQSALARLATAPAPRLSGAGISGTCARAASRGAALSLPEGESMRSIIMPAAALLALAGCASAGRGHPAPDPRAVLPAQEESSPVRLSDQDRRAVERDLRSALERLAPTEADSARGPARR